MNPLRKISLAGLVVLIGFLEFSMTHCQQSRDSLIQDAGTGQLTLFPNTPQGKAIQQHIYTVTALGEDAEQKYQASLGQIRKDSTIHLAIFDLYKSTAEDQYLLRTLLVQTLNDLHGGKETLGMLQEIASAPLPPEKSKSPEFSTRQEESIIRVTAVEGITATALDKNAEAERMLMALTDNPDLTVRQMAVRGYLSVGAAGSYEEKAKMLRGRLPQEQHWMITNKATDIRTVPHPAMPEKFDLKNQQKSSNSAPKINNK